MVFREGFQRYKIENFAILMKFEIFKFFFCHDPSLLNFISQLHFLRLEFQLLDSIWRQWNGSEEGNICIFSFRNISLKCYFFR